MFGSRDAPFKISEENVKLVAELKDGAIYYEREIDGKNLSKIILSDKVKFLINPIEPFNSQQEITDKLLIKFSDAIDIGPRSTKKMYLTFPTEIGIFVMGKRDTDIIDSFTLARQKFTLYGDVRSGVICRYWESEITTDPQEVDKNKEGILELYIINPTSKWTEISHAVFSAHGMKLYYNDEKVMMKARMKILTRESAETDFFDSPPEKNMKRALELYTDKVLSILSTKFSMEAGL